ncbi:MAG: tetratricopeptide repeat protein [Candidatus Hodarchaeota archaeon]
MPGLVNEKLENMNQLFIEGLYLKIRDSIVDFEQREDLTPEDRLSCYLLKSNLYYELGEHTDALKFAEQACSLSQELGLKTLLIDSYISKAWALLELRDFDLVLESILKGEELLKNLTIEPQLEFAKRDALLKLVKSALYVYKSGNIDKALEYGGEGLKISEEYDNKKELALALQLNSLYYLIAGNLDLSLEYLEECLKVQKTYRKRDDWLIFKDLGVLHGIKGELNIALEYTKQSLALAEEIGNKNFIGQCINNSALIYRQKGDLDLAMEALERNITIWEELDNKRNLMGGLDSLFIVCLDVNSIRRAQQYLMRMQQINEQVKDKGYDVACRVNKALMLKMSPNSLDLEKAKEILQQIVEEEIINWEFTERALLHLCEIFLLELHTYDNQEVLSDINLLINRLQEYAESQHSIRMLTEVNLLRGKFALIKMNMGHARQFLTRAQSIADEHGLHLLARTVSSEHDKLLEQLEEWEHLRRIKAPVSERLKIVEIDKTLDHMMGKKMMEPPEMVDEDPILLIIMDEAGNAYFNHKFIEDWDHSDLFSSFMSAFNTFSSEVFSKTIDRIKIGENLISINPVKPFLTCYVSKGQSYPAIKKLKKFSDSIRAKSEIWKQLKKAAKSNQELRVNNVPLLGDIVNEIFVH